MSRQPTFRHVAQLLAGKKDAHQYGTKQSKFAFICIRIVRTAGTAQRLSNGHKESNI
jgi:hypothetical protein